MKNSVTKLVNKLEKSLPEHWQKTTWLTKTLTPVASIYGLVVNLRQKKYNQKKYNQNPMDYHAHVPVIVVGNPTVGGVGKTPLVIYLAQRLLRMGYKPAIISRGYKGKSLYWPLDVKASTDYELCGDEPLMMALRFRSSNNTLSCPVITAPKRVQSIEYIKNHYPEVNVIISDDGLQHYAMPRDLEIIVLDAKRQLGNGKFFPAGPLRESQQTMQQRIEKGALVVENFAHHSFDIDSKDRQNRFAMQFATGLLYKVNNPYCRLRLKHIKTQVNINAVAAIGNPQRFFEYLQKLGFVIKQQKVFADHYAYQSDDLMFDNDLPVIMTEKDAVKCLTIAHDKCWYLSVEAILSDGFDNAIQQFANTYIEHNTKQLN